MHWAALYLFLQPGADVADILWGTNVLETTMNRPNVLEMPRDAFEILSGVMDYLFAQWDQYETESPEWNAIADAMSKISSCSAKIALERAGLLK